MSTVELDSDWPSELDSNSKGTLGEGIVETHIWSVIRENPGDLLPEFEGNDPADLFTQLRHNRYFGYRMVGEDGSIDNISWKADLTYSLSNIYADSGGEASISLAVEVKTGKYAEVERDQKRVMGLVNQNSEYLVLLARVSFESEPLFRIRYQTLETDESTNSGFRFRALNRSI